MVSWIVIFIFLPTEFFFIAFYKSGFNLCVSFEVISIMYKKARKKRERERTKKLGRLKKNRKEKKPNNARETLGRVVSLENA